MAGPQDTGGARRAPTRADFLRRRAVALGLAAGVLLMLVTLVRGDSGSPFGAALAGNLTPAQAATLPWRQRYVSGSAGPLDGRGLPSPVAQRAAIARYYRLGLPLYCAGGRGSYAALTFDDGPSPFSSQVLALLQRAGAQTTHFVIGQQVPVAVDVTRREHANGDVEDHTWTHPFLTRLSAHDQDFELGQTQRTLERTLGAPVLLMRPPYGAFDARVGRAVHKFGMVPVLWDVDTRDSLGAATPQIVANADAGLHPGAIILMHETYDRSLAALPQVLAAARRKGLRLVSVPQLLALDSPPDSLVRAGPSACSDRQRYRQQEDSTSMRLARDGGQSPA
ncbi:MAG: polysaccharide deacetylase family protein [Actinomycetota bacterium]|nr:polysaccharide deacetylase family protein [Actinomycetota bacterium]